MERHSSEKPLPPDDPANKAYRKLVEEERGKYPSLVSQFEKEENLNIVESGDMAAEGVEILNELLRSGTIYDTDKLDYVVDILRDVEDEESVRTFETLIKAYDVLEREVTVAGAKRFLEAEKKVKPSNE